MFQITTQSTRFACESEAHSNVISDEQCALHRTALEVLGVGRAIATVRLIRKVLRCRNVLVLLLIALACRHRQGILASSG